MQKIKIIDNFFVCDSMFIGENKQMKKVDYFKDELNLIKTERIRNFLEIAIEDMPDYFFVVPASSSGKHHPQYALGKGGLLRHTKAAVGFAKHFSGLEMFGQFSQIKWDLIVCALVLHDSRKSGQNYEYSGQAKDDNGEYITKTDPKHPIYAAISVLKIHEENKLLDLDELNFLCTGMLTHMGQWNKDFEGNEILQKPTMPHQKLIHLCDYLASRNNLEFVFEEEKTFEK